MKEKKKISDTGLEKRFEQLEEKALQKKSIARKILNELDREKQVKR